MLQVSSRSCRASARRSPRRQRPHRARGADLGPSTAMAARVPPPTPTDIVVRAEPAPRREIRRRRPIGVGDQRGRVMLDGSERLWRRGRCRPLGREPERRAARSRPCSSARRPPHGRRSEDRRPRQRPRRAQRGGGSGGGSCRPPNVTLVYAVLKRASARHRGRAQTRESAACCIRPSSEPAVGLLEDPERRNVGRVHLVAVLGDVADLHVLRGHPQRDEQADDLQQDEGHDADQTITHAPAKTCHLSSDRAAVDEARRRSVIGVVRAARMCGSANTPVSRPPARPAKPWV